MDVIGNSANLHRLHLILSRYSTHERPEPFLEAGLDERPTFLGAELAVVIGTDVRHAVIQPSLRDLCYGKPGPKVETLG